MQKNVRHILVMNNGMVNPIGDRTRMPAGPILLVRAARSIVNSRCGYMRGQQTEMNLRGWVGESLKRSFIHPELFVFFLKERF